MIRVFLLFLFLLTSTSFADASLPLNNIAMQEIKQLAEAEITFKTKNYSKAIILYQPLAKKGNVFAQYQLGYCYLKGLGVIKNDKQGFEWLIKAANQKLPEAEFALGMMYYHGVYVAQDLDQAISLFKKAASTSNNKPYSPHAAYMMGLLRENGYGVTRNYADALHWYTLSAALGLPQAEYNLGLLHYSSINNGVQIPQDYNKALNYFFLAANQNHTKAAFMEGLMYSLGQGTPIDKKQAANWYAQAAGAGLDIAQYNLGIMYYTGDGIPINLPLAIQLTAKAAYNNLPAAQYLLGFFAMNGVGMPADPQIALAWYQKSAQQGFGEAQFALGYFYHKGIAAQQDNRQALTWFFAAAKSGIVNAQYMLGLFYQEGIAVSKDPKIAAYWYSQSAMQGMENAQLMLGLMYAQGQGVPQDNRIAYAWFDLASASTNPAFYYSVIRARNEVMKKMSPADIQVAEQVSLQIHQRMIG